MAKPNRRERGAAMTEFVVVIPILVVLLFSIVQFGLVLNRVQTYNAAAREGARVASLPNTDQAKISSTINNALDGMNIGDTPAVSTNPSASKPCEGRPGETVTVTVQSPYTIQIPLLPNFNVNLSGKGIFRCE